MSKTSAHIHVHGSRISVSFKSANDREDFKNNWLSGRKLHLKLYITGGGWEKMVTVWLPDVNAVEW